MENKLIQGDCLEVMKDFEDNSIDLICSDIPYGLTNLDPLKLIQDENLKGKGFIMFLQFTPRQDAVTVLNYRLLQAGFNINFTSMFHVYASGFPKALNIAKNISKTIDNYKNNDYIKSLWKRKLNNVQFAERIFVKNLIEIGTHTDKKSFVVEDVQQYLKTKKLNWNVSIVKKKLSEVQAIFTKMFIVPVNVEQKQKQDCLDVVTVVKKSENQNHKQDFKIVFVPINVLHFLCEKEIVKIKDAEVQRIENGNPQSSNGTLINAICVEVIKNFRHTTLSQLAIILNYDTTLKTELPSVMNVIITKSIEECLIINTGNILAKNLKGSYGGLQVKPSVELIIVAMKPLSEKTFTEQALKNGKGITWLDDCRIPTNKETEPRKKWEEPSGNYVGYGGTKENWNVPYTSEYRNKKITEYADKGRFPANIIVQDDALNDGEIREGKFDCKRLKDGQIYWEGKSESNRYGGFNDSGSFSRYFDLDAWFEKKLSELPERVQKTFPFFIVAKPSKAEKNKGCEELEEQWKGYGNQFIAEMKRGNNPSDIKNKSSITITKMRNNHPTIKPIKLYSYLITMGSREGDLVCDPFVGSGTTCLAAAMLNRKYIGIEKDAEYYKIAEKRINEFTSQQKLF